MTSYSTYHSTLPATAGVTLLLFVTGAASLTEISSTRGGIIGLAGVCMIVGTFEQVQKRLPSRTFGPAVGGLIAVGGAILPELQPAFNAPETLLLLPILALSVVAVGVELYNFRADFSET